MSKHYSTVSHPIAGVTPIHVRCWKILSIVRRAGGLNRKWPLWEQALTYSVIEKWHADRMLTFGKIKHAHPGIETSYTNAFREAYARAHYYKARWSVQENRRGEALHQLWNICGAGWRYPAPYVALRIFTRFWNFVHSFLPSA